MATPDQSDPGLDGPSPPFGLHEAERIVRRLVPALQAHGMWIQSVHTALICRTAPADPDADGEAYLRSSLGRWFACESNEFIRGHPDYVAAAAHHREAYARARELYACEASHQAITPEEYLAFSEAAARLDRNLESLIKEVWDLLRHTDPVTGIATRHAMLPRLREEHERVQRTGLTCSVCMVDLDHFKRINDTWGHDAGDAVLEAVSGYLMRNLRRYDQVFRYGGEEFVLMLPNSCLEQAVPIVDRLRRGVDDLAIGFEDRTLGISASFGIAPLLADQPIGVSIKRADEAMYTAKRAGRNRIATWHPGGAVVHGDDASAPAPTPSGS